jgi:5-methylcytosine-specific restriction protein A
VFDPGLNIGQIIKNADLVSIFRCGNMGGMRRAKKTNTLVLISDYTKGLYHDKWIGGVLHYTGMGKNGDQDLHWLQNRTLAESRFNGVDVHLFEVIDAGEYIYCGRVKLVEEPYTEMQNGEDGRPRKVWMFPIKPVPDNDVQKPAMFVFKDMQDYQTRGKHVDAEYAKMKRANKKGDRTKEYIPPSIPKPIVQPKLEIPKDIVGKQVKHKSYGIGVVTGISGNSIVVKFDAVGEKKMGYDFCVKKKLLEIKK